MSNNHFVTGRISVIMPCYNAGKYVNEAVDSVLNQTYPDVELIVVDDGSSDDSVEILQSLAQKYEGRMTLLFQDHKGPYPARNLGLGHARGDLIAFLDADDYWRSDCLEQLHAALSLNKADLAYCGWQNFGNAAANTEPFIPPKYEDGDMVAEFLRSCPWPIHAALIRRQVIDAVDGFSERCFSAMDYDIWIRILAHTKKMILVPEVMAFYRWHGRQISTNKWKQVMNALRVRKDFATHHPEQVAHLAPEKLWELTDGFLLRMAYRAYWDRDLTTAQKLLRRAFIQGIWKPKDLKYMLPSLLPAPLFRLLVETASTADKDESA